MILCFFTSTSFRLAHLIDLSVLEDFEKSREVVTEGGEELLGEGEMQKHMVAHVLSMSEYPVCVADEAEATHHRRQNREGKVRRCWFKVCTTCGRVTTRMRSQEEDHPPL